MAKPKQRLRHTVRRPQVKLRFPVRALCEKNQGGPGLRVRRQRAYVLAKTGLGKARGARKPQQNQKWPNAKYRGSKKYARQRRGADRREKAELYGRPNCKETAP